MTNGNTFGKASQYGTPGLGFFFGNLKSAARPLPTC